MGGGDVRNAVFFETNATNPGTVGELRLGEAEEIVWRNNANSADLILLINASDELVFDGTILGAGGGATIELDNLGTTAINANLNLDAGIDLVLSSTSQLLWGAGESIGIEGGDMIFDIPTTDDFEWQINATPEMVLTIARLDIDQKYLEIESITNPGVTGSLSTGRIFMDSGNSDILSIIRNGSVISLEAQGGEFTGPMTATHNYAGNTIDNVGVFNSNAADIPNAGQIRLGNGETITFRNTADNGQATISMDVANYVNISNANGIHIGSGNIQFNGTTRSINPTANGLQLDASTAGSIDIRVTDADEYVFDATQADFKGNNLLNVGEIQLQEVTQVFVGTEASITRGSTDISYQAETGGIHNFVIGTSLQFQMNGTFFDLRSHAMNNVNYVEFDSTNVATTGVLRLSVAEDIVWRNNANDGNLLLSVNGSDELVFDGTILGSGGAPQTPIAQDIEYAGFDIKDISNVELRVTTGAPGGATRAIYGTADEMVFNVPLLDGWAFKVNDITRYAFSNDGNISNVNSLIDGTANPATAGQIRQGNNAGGIAWRNAGNTANIQIRVDSNDEFLILGGDVNFQGQDIRDLSNLEFRTPSDSDPAATIHAIFVNAGGELNFNVPSGEFHSFGVAGGEDLRISAGVVSLVGADLAVSGNELQFAGGVISRGATPGQLEYNVTSTHSHFWQVDGTNEMILSSTVLDLQGNQLVLGSNSNVILFGAGETIGIETGDMIFDVPTTDDFEWQIAGTPEMVLSATALDLSGTAKNILMVDNSDIQWGGSADRKIKNTTGGFEFEIETGDTFQWTIQNGAEMILSATVLDIDAKYIEIESIASPGVTGSATVGRIFMDSGNSNELSIIRNGSVISLEGAGGGGGATTELDNLGTTAVNAQINMGTNNLDFETGGQITWNASESIGIEASDMVFDLSSGDFYKFDISAVTQYDFGETRADFHTNDLIELGNLTFSDSNALILWSAGESIGIEGGDMVFDVPSTDDFEWQIAGAVEMRMSVAQGLQMQGNIIQGAAQVQISSGPLSLDSGQIVQWGGGPNALIRYTVGSGMLLEVDGTETFDFFVNNVKELEISNSALT